MSLLEWFGAVVALLMCFFFLAVAVSFAAERLDQLWYRWQCNHAEIISRRVGTRLGQQCYYLSENDAAMHALEALGEALRDTGDWDMSEVRERWRDLLREGAE